MVRRTPRDHDGADPQPGPAVGGKGDLPVEKLLHTGQHLQRHHLTREGHDATGQAPLGGRHREEDLGGLLLSDHARKVVDLPSTGSPAIVRPRLLGASSRKPTAWMPWLGGYGSHEPSRHRRCLPQREAPAFAVRPAQPGAARLGAVSRSGCVMRTPEAKRPWINGTVRGKPSEAVKINSPTAKSAAVPIPTAATIRSTSPRLTCLYT